MLSAFSQLNTHSDDHTFTFVLFHLVLTRKLTQEIDSRNWLTELRCGIAKKNVVAGYISKLRIRSECNKHFAAPVSKTIRLG